MTIKGNETLGEYTLYISVQRKKSNYKYTERGKKRKVGFDIINSTQRTPVVSQPITNKT